MHFGAFEFSSNGLRTIVPKISKQLYAFWYQLVGFLLGFLVLHKSTTLIITQNNKERHVFSKQPVMVKAWDHCQVSLFGVYGG